MSSLSLERLRKKAPQLVFVAIAIAIIVVVLIEVLEDVLVEGMPLNSGPLGTLINAIILFTHGVTGAISSLGYVAVFVLMLFEASSLPIPSEVILPFAGYLVSTGQLSFYLTLTVATIAGVLGSLIDYYIGLKGAHALTERRFLGRAFLSEGQLNTAVNWFNRHGAIMVFVSRLIPGFRTIISFPAGAVRMPLKKFVVYTIVGCFVWNGLLIYVGYFLGIQWSEVADVSHYLIIATFVVIVLAVLVFVFRRRKRFAAQKARLLKHEM